MTGSARAGALRPETVAGVWYGLAAYGWWAIAPIFWKLLEHVPPLVTLLHRVVWGGLCFALLLGLSGRLRELRGVLDGATLRVFAASAALLATNWFLFVFAVVEDRVLEASLGYFINPLFNVVLGMIFLGERPRRLQWIAVMLAALGVLLMTWSAGALPWISLCLAGSFGVYGLVRKTAPAGPLVGSTLETMLMLGPALAILAVTSARRGGLDPIPADLRDLLLLVASGAVTALPLLWFSCAARRLQLTTLGFLQYIAPTGQFVLAVAAFGEPFAPLELLAFLLIWIALAIFSVDLTGSARARVRPTAPVPLQTGQQG